MHYFKRSNVSSNFRRGGRGLFASTAVASALVGLLSTPASAAPLPQPNTLVSVCSGVSLPPSAVTGIIDPVLTGIYGPIESRLNGILTLIDPLIVLPLPSPLSVDVNGLLTTAAGGSSIGLNVLASDGTLVGPSGQCDATADSFSLDTPAGVAIGGNQITGLGANGQQAVAGEINSIAIGNRASTDPSAVGATAVGPDANVGSSAIGSVAIGSNASATAANSVALGADSVADRAGTVSIGAAGAERQLVNVAAGTQATDAVNLGQLQAATQDAVQYDDASHTLVTFGGVGGTTLTNVKAGAVTATSSDAVNGSQLYGVQQQVNNNTTAITNLQTATGGNTTAITNLQTNVSSNTTAITSLQTNVSANTTAIAGNTTAITNLRADVQNGAIGPVQYSDPAAPSVPNGGTPTNDVTLVGAAPGAVGMHNVANGFVGAGSTDAINGDQLFSAIFGVVPDVVSYDDASHQTVTLNAGGNATVIRNVAPGTAPTDAVNLGQVNGMVTTAQSNTINIVNEHFDLLDGQLRRDRRDARAGTSAALAAAGMPQAVGEGRTMIAGGIGTYRGRVGFAAGASHRSNNGKAIYRLGITYDSSEHVGANAGAGFEF